MASVPSYSDFCRAHYGDNIPAATLQLRYNKMLAEHELEGGNRKKQEGVESLDQFRRIVGECHSGEDTRLIDRHPKYRETIRRQVFIALLTGRFDNYKDFRDAARVARMADPPTPGKGGRTSPGGYGHAADRHAVRLAMRVLYYRRVCRNLPDGLATDHEPVSDAVAREEVGKILRQHNIVIKKSVLSQYCPGTGRKQTRRRAALDAVPA